MRLSVVTDYGSCSKFLLAIFMTISVFVNAVCLQDRMVFAQGTANTRLKGITLSPLRNELEINPGTVIDGYFTIKNSSDKSLEVNFDADEFNVINQQYDYAFTTESDVTKWITFTPQKVTLAAGKSEEITYSVGVPLSTEPGGRYISLFACTDAGQSSNGINTLQRIGSLLYITVLGDISRTGQLVSLTSPWSISKNSTWSMAVRNSGTTHFRSRYNVQAQNVIGHTTIKTMSGEALILPGTVRSVSDSLPLPDLPGFYKYVFTIGLGDTPAVIKTNYVLYLPSWAAASVVVIIVFSVYYLARRYSKRRQSV